MPSLLKPFTIYVPPVFLAGGIAVTSPIHAGALDSKSVNLFVASGGAVRFTLTNAMSGQYEATSPINLQLLMKSGATCWLSNSYSSLNTSGQGLSCAGTVRTAAGSVFQISDTFQQGPENDCFLLKRKVVVQQAAPEDARFLTRFSICSSVAQPLCCLSMPPIFSKSARQALDGCVRLPLSGPA